MCHGRYFQTFPILEDAVQQRVIAGDGNLKWIALQVRNTCIFSVHFLLIFNVNKFLTCGFLYLVPLWKSSQNYRYVFLSAGGFKLSGV